MPCTPSLFLNPAKKTMEKVTPQFSMLMLGKTASVSVKDPIIAHGINA
jgi:hypothetical protein